MALLAGAAVAVGLLAALTAWAAQLGGGAWLPVLVPFALVLTVPLAALAWLHRGEHTDERVPAPGDPDQRPGSLVDRAWFGRGVPLARRNLFQDRRRVLLSTGGVAVALLLVLILGGIFAGAMRQLTSYIDHSGADLVVSQAGVTTMHMSASVLRPDIADRIRATPGVAWAEPIRYTTGMVSSPAGQSASYVIGYQPTVSHAGPSRLVTGHQPGAGEAVLDRQAADQLRLRVGDRVRILGRSFTLVGLSSGGTNIANTTVFIPTGDFARLRGPAQAYVLVGARQGSDLGVLRARLEGIPPGVTVQTSGQFATSERRIVTDMSADLLRIMSGIGFGIALAVIALTLFNVTVAKTREYGWSRRSAPAPAGSSASSRPRPPGQLAWPWPPPPRWRCCWRWPSAGSTPRWRSGSPPAAWPARAWARSWSGWPARSFPSGGCCTWTPPPHSGGQHDHPNHHPRQPRPGPAGHRADQDLRTRGTGRHRRGRRRPRRPPR
jgi:putative ABC transport system permease protein